MNPDKMLSEAEIALEPCPFCGGKASFGTLKYGPGNAELIELNGQDTFYSVNCQHCPGQVQGIIGHKSKDDAAKAWNKRPKPACQYCEDKGTFPAEKYDERVDRYMPFIETCSCAAGKSLQEKNAPKPRQDAGRVEAKKDGATILDACCGSRMFWFDRADPRCIFLDKRREKWDLKDKSSKGGSRALVIEPDVQGDFTALPFPDGRFSLVCFDPPHLLRNGAKGWLAKKYGKLGEAWRSDLTKGFAECFRVLAPMGTLVFKWNENDIPVSQVLALTPEQPLFGNRQGKQAKSHWIVFQKPAALTLEAKPQPSHSCQDGHWQIFYDGDNPDCPLCEVKSELAEFKTLLEDIQTLVPDLQVFKCRKAGGPE